MPLCAQPVNTTNPFSSRLKIKAKSSWIMSSSQWASLTVETPLIFSKDVSLAISPVVKTFGWNQNGEFTGTTTALLFSSDIVIGKLIYRNLVMENFGWRASGWRIMGRVFLPHQVFSLNLRWVKMSMTDHYCIYFGEIKVQFLGIMKQHIARLILHRVKL